ncbi:putative toxin-antitoxin system toxin component, PIN family [archaeon]|nr:putative toxin-antitoxin system toxin component, PIN family [archaeon]
MINVVFDTNIFVSSIFWEKGNPHKAVEFALEKKVRVFTFVEILRELERVLGFFIILKEKITAFRICFFCGRS